MTRHISTYNTTGLITPQTRSCTECGSSFKGTGKAKYCSHICRSRNEYAANMLKPEWRLGKLAAMAKNRAKAKGLQYNIDKEYLIALWQESQGCCALTGIPFDLESWGNHGQVNPNSPSVDRITPSLGYTRGNVRLITYHLNIALSDFGTELFERLIDSYRSYR